MRNKQKEKRQAEEPPVRRKTKVDAPKDKKEKKKKATSEKAEAHRVAKKTTKEDKQKDKKEKKRKRDRGGDYPETYGMMGHAMMPMMGMMRPMGYPMMPGMMMMPGGLIGMGMHQAYSLPGMHMIRPKKKGDERRRRFTEAPAGSATEEVVEEPQKRSPSASSSSASTSEAKNAGQPTVAMDPAALGEGELELGLISPEQQGDAEEQSPLQVPPGMESPVLASPKGAAGGGWPNKPSSWVEVEGETETIEELQRELEVTQNKACISIATQTDAEIPAEDFVDGLQDRWFKGFVDAIPPGAKAREESSSSSDEENICRPERQLRQRSRSQSEGGPKEKASEDSSSSSSSSSGGSRKRQRAPSSDEEATKAQSVAEKPVNPRQLRVIQDYSDVV